MKIINYALAVLFIYCLFSCQVTNSEAKDILNYYGITEFQLEPGEHFDRQCNDAARLADVARGFRGVKNGVPVSGVICEYQGANFQPIFEVELD